MTKRRTIDIATSVVEAFKGVVRDDPWILGHDPGGRSTGLAFVEGGRCTFSAQGEPAAVLAMYRSVVGQKRVDVYVREQPYMRVDHGLRDVDKAAARAHTAMESLWKMGLAAGAVSFSLRADVKLAAWWEPLPMSARAVIGLNRKATATQTAREATNEAVLLWARATTGRDLCTERGAPCYDEANALVLAFAADALLKNIRRM